jgi:ribonuclease HII
MKTKAFPHLACRMNSNCTEAGCDEAGRGCLAGPVFAAAVILPPKFECAKLNDSKQLSENDRDELRIFIEKQALCFAVASCFVIVFEVRSRKFGFFYRNPVCIR